MEHFRRCEHHAARQFGCLHAGQVQGGALSGDGFLRRAAMHLHSANPQTLAGRMDFDLLLLVDSARNQSACHHGPEALHGEHAINWQPEDSAGIFGRNLGGQPSQLAL